MSSSLPARVGRVLAGLLVVLCLVTGPSAGAQSSSSTDGQPGSTPRPAVSTEANAGSAPPISTEASVDTAPPEGPPDVVGDLFPFAAVALAVGAAAGFELSRRGL